MASTDYQQGWKTFLRQLAMAKFTDKKCKLTIILKL